MPKVPSPAEFHRILSEERLYPVLAKDHVLVQVGTQFDGLSVERILHRQWADLGLDRQMEHIQRPISGGLHRDWRVVMLRALLERHGHDSSRFHFEHLRKNKELVGIKISLKK